MKGYARAVSGIDDYRVLRLEAVSGRVWIVDEREQAGPSFKTPFYGWEEGAQDHRYWVQRAIGGDEWEAEREHLRQAHRIGQLPEVAASPLIHAPVDLIDGFDVYLVSDLADTDLQRVLRDGPLNEDEAGGLERRLRAALEVLHGLGLVHSDLREDNVLRVGGAWKLGDLGGVVRRGDPIVCLQLDEAYHRGGAALGAPAMPENDLHALGVVLEHTTRQLPR